MALREAQSVEWTDCGRPRDGISCPHEPKRLDLDEGEHASVEGDDIDLAAASAEVARDDLEATTFEVLAGERLTASADCATGIGRPPLATRWTVLARR